MAPKKMPPKPKRAPKKSAPMKSMPMSSSDKAQHEKWMAEEDVRTLQRAGEIERDKARLARAQATAKKQAEDLARITGKKAP